MHNEITLFKIENPNNDTQHNETTNSTIRPQASRRASRTSTKETILAQSNT